MIIPDVTACTSCNLEADPGELVCRNCGGTEFRIWSGREVSEEEADDYPEDDPVPGRLLYLASPMDKAHGHSETLLWRSSTYAASQHFGWIVYDPSTSFTFPVGGRAPTPAVQLINFDAVSHSDAVLALLPEGAYTIGVPMEIQFALSRGIPVAVVGANHSFALAGSSAFLADDVTAAFDWLEEATQSAEDNSGLQLLIRLDSPDAVMPTKAYGDDAGWDLYASEEVVVPSGGYCDVPLGISMAIPDGYYANIVARSSTFRNRWIDVRPAVMDAGYRGPWFAGVHNVSPSPTVIAKGERVAQVLIHRVPLVRLHQVDELPPSERGSSGFGSSGL